MIRSVSPWRAGAIAATCVVLAAASSYAALGGEQLDPLDPLVQPAAMSTRATASVLIAATRAGERVVAAGESGVVLLSDDRGQTWQQAKVPVSVTLTSLTFASAMKGWAVGHSGIVLTTADGGKSWSKQLDGTSLAQLGAAVAGGSAGDPLLDVYFKDEANGFAVGAFGLMLRTRDGGVTWEGWQQHLPNPEGNHLYGIRAVGGDLYVVGERGSIYVSSDGGDSFSAVKSPYEGSFFGLAAAADGAVLVYGLRGHAFRSADRGQTWKEIKVGSGSAWLSAATLPDGRIVMVSQAGEVAQSDTGGADFTLLPGRQPPLTAVVGAGPDVAVTAGVRGIGLVQLPAARSGV